MRLFDIKKNSIWLVLLLVLLGVTANPVFSETEKERDIKKLLEVSGILRQLSYMEDTLMNSVSMPLIELARRLAGGNNMGKNMGNTISASFVEIRYQ